MLRGGRSRIIPAPPAELPADGPLAHSELVLIRVRQCRERFVAHDVGVAPSRHDVTVAAAGLLAWQPMLRDPVLPLLLGADREEAVLVEQPPLVAEGAERCSDLLAYRLPLLQREVLHEDCPHFGETLRLDATLIGDRRADLVGRDGARENCGGHF